MRRTKKLPLEQLAPFLLPETPRSAPIAPIDWQELFGRSDPVEIEVGFGKGLFLTTAASARSDVNFFGVEIVRKYQLFVATRLLKRGLANVRVACGDARLILRDRVPTASVQAVHVYFPDPWWKTRHRKRRVFTPEFAHTCGKVLAVGGVLSLATDVEAYHAVMTRIVRDLGSAFRELPPPSASQAVDEMDYLTNFERKFRKQRRPIYRAAYMRTDDALPVTLASDPGIAGQFTEYTATPDLP